MRTTPTGPVLKRPSEKDRIYAGEVPLNAKKKPKTASRDTPEYYNAVIYFLSIWAYAPAGETPCKTNLPTRILTIPELTPEIHGNVTTRSIHRS